MSYELPLLRARSSAHFLPRQFDNRLCDQSQAAKLRKTVQLKTAGPINGHGGGCLEIPLFFVRCSKSDPMVCLVSSVVVVGLRVGPRTCRCVVVGLCCFAAFLTGSVDLHAKGLTKNSGAIDLQYQVDPPHRLTQP